MKLLNNSRQFHKALAPWIFLNLFISTITGLIYRISKDLLGYSRDQVHWLIRSMRANGLEIREN